MRLVSAFFVSSCLGALLAAQSPQAPAPNAQRPTFKAGVNFVRVDVYPTANGHIVADLKQNEFQVLEDGVPQRIETFERVAIGAPGPESERAEPRTVAEANQAAANPYNRLFVLFLDSYHASVDFSTLNVGGGVGATSSGGGAQSAAEGRTGLKTSKADSRIGGALVRFFDRLIGPDDLVGLLRPEEPVTSLTFTRRPASFYELLMTGGWERRFVADDFDERERMYRLCYGADSPIAKQMIARRRERMVIDALHGLVVHLRNLREERKAIVVITEGWQLYRPDASLRPSPAERVPGGPPIGVAGGRPAIGDSSVGNIRPDCDRDRMMLADLDNEADFRRLLDEANRANATFYPIDPRGLPAFDTPIGPDKPLTPAADSAALSGRITSLQTLAGATDGIALVNSNALDANLRRISDDLSSYYLLGYYSTNPKHDGKFRKITVRITRPGVTLRARRGYLAPTEAEVKAAEAEATAADPVARSMESALDMLDRSRPNQILLLRGSSAWPSSPANAGTGRQAGARPAASAAPGAVLSVIVELDPIAARGPGWAQGGQLTASILDLDGRTLATGTGTISPTSRTCLIRFGDNPLPAGDYLARVKAVWSVLTTTEQLRIKVPHPSESVTSLGQPLAFRRGPFTGPGFQPTADMKFRKAERVRLDIPLTQDVDSVAGQLLDRRGQPLQVPVTTAIAEEAGARIARAEVVLAPLAAGEYVVEVSARRGERTDKSLTAIRIIP